MATLARTCRGRGRLVSVGWPLLAQMRSADRVRKRLVFGVNGRDGQKVKTARLTLSGRERICGAPHQARVADTSAATIAGYLRCPRAEAIHGGSSVYHSGLIPAALIMGHHLSISALCRAASASGVC
jgi:hypothetical protein